MITESHLEYSWPCREFSGDFGNQLLAAALSMPLNFS